MSRFRFALAVLAAALAFTAKPAFADGPYCPGIIEGGGNYCSFTGRLCGGGTACLYDCWSLGSGDSSSHCYSFGET